MEHYIMAIDQGTTGSRVLIVNPAGHIVANAYSEFPQVYPRPGWVEHDPEAIWQATRAVMGQALASAGIGPGRIAAMGIANQRETTVVWERSTLKPVHNAIVWQCRRSAAICEALRAAGLEAMFRERTGLLLDAYFSGTKLKWLLDEIPGLRRRAESGELAFGTVDSWLVARLTGGRTHVTDVTNASRTLMFNIHDRAWDPELLAALEIPAALMPAVVPSSRVAGRTDTAVAGAEIPIAGIAGDQQAALYGQACFDAGQAKNTYGTGCFLLINSGRRPVDPGPGLLLTLACDGDGQPCYALEGSVFIAGAVVQWLRDGLGLIRTAAETQALAESVPDSQGVFLVPAFAGLGAPHWDMYARGGILGITRGTTRAHIVRAALEGIAFQTRDLAGAVEAATGMRFGELRVDGGACRNDFLMQFQADLLDCTISRSRYLESTAMGAAFLAGRAVGFWRGAGEIAALRSADKTFSPMIDTEKRRRLVRGWAQAVERVKSRA
ncbi:MAG: glycerol kinase GlpK [Desulfobacterales bacterium]|jgi:glycerol kinase|nr:glycerol kinase GlpK [Desulfobacterales bacterium]